MIVLSKSLSDLIRWIALSQEWFAQDHLFDQCLNLVAVNSCGTGYFIKCQLI